VGALRALDEAVEGLDLKDLDIYVGVSAGAFIAANLANRLTPSQMCRALVKPDPDEHPFNPEIFLRPAFGELVNRSLRLPGLALQGLWDFVRRPREVGAVGALQRLSRALPVGLLDNEPIRAYLERIYTMKARSDDFRRLERPLVVVATDLESGEAARFGAPGLDHVPISRAVQASTALPGLYPPVEIEGRYYVDGVLLKTVHASVALEAGAELVLCLNPIVPVDLLRGRDGSELQGFLVDRGLPTVLSQTFRTMIHSRLQVGMGTYDSRYRGADVVLLEPPRDDFRMFFTNIFAFTARKAICEHAYQVTRAELSRRYDELSPILRRHGLRLRRQVLADRDRSLWSGVGITERGGVHTLDRLELALQRVERIVADRSPGAARVDGLKVETPSPAQPDPASAV
jgi:NTE family protein